MKMDPGNDSAHPPESAHGPIFFLPRTGILLSFLLADMWVPRVRPVSLLRPSFTPVAESLPPD
jgi:hypothetical protein